MRVFSPLVFLMVCLLTCQATGIGRADSYVVSPLGIGSTEPARADEDAAVTFYDTLTREERKWLEAHPVIRTGFVSERTPFEFLDANGREHGLIADYLSLISRRLHVSFRRVAKEDGTPLSWGEIQEAGRQKQLDFLPSLTRNRNRETYLCFTRPYLDFPWVMVARSNHEPSGNVKDFYGQKVAVVSSYPIRKELPVKYPKLHIVPVETPLEGLMAVAGGRADAMVMNAVYAAYHMKKHNLKQLEIACLLEGFDSRLCMGVRRDWPMLARILDKTLSSLTPSECAAIQNQWVSIEFNPGVDWAELLKIGIPVALSCLVVFVLIFMANRRLKKEVVMRRLAEDKAMQSQEEFRIIADYTYGLESWHDETGTLRWINRSVARITGYTCEESLAMPDFPKPLVVPEDWPECKAVLRAALSRKAGTDALFRIRRKDGAVRWLLSSWNPVFNDAGTFLGFRASGQDYTERRRAEEALRESDERLRISLEVAGTNYWQLDTKNDRFSYSSLHLFKKAGYTEQEVPKTLAAFFSFVHPDDLPQVQAAFGQYAQGDAPTVRYDYRLRRKDSGWMWLHTVYWGVDKDGQGRAAHIAGLSMDITQRQKLLERIKESQERLQFTLESVGAFYFQHDLKTDQFSFDSSQLFSSMGFPDEKVPRTSEQLASYIHPDDLPRVRQGISPLFSGDIFLTSVDYRISYDKKDWLWINALAQPLETDRQGNVTRTAGLIMDITERQKLLEQVEQAKKQAERGLSLMSKVFEAAADSILISDLSGNITDVNEATVAAYGYSREELLGHKIWGIVPDEMTEKAIKLYQRCKSGELIRAMEWSRKKKDGTVIPILLTLSLLKNDEGKPLGIASITKDISELKKTEQELNAYKDHLESLVKERTADLQEAMQVAKEATRAKSEFLANMSHEIRTPLNAVIGFSHLALQTELNDLQSDYIHKIQGSSKALLGVINDILDFSKIEAGKLTMEIIEFSLEEVLDNITALVGIKAQEKGLEVIFNIDPSLPDVLVGDPLRLGQILVNLTGNSLKFTEKGQIVLGCRLLKDGQNEVELEFFVQDSGIGMTPEQLDRLFCAFTQADASTTRKYGGTGLGLAITKSLVEMMAGRIWVESDMGQGTTFFFTVGLKKSRSRPAGPLLPETGLRDKKVLVVDDNPLCRTVLQELLESMSFRVTQAESADAALAELETAAQKEPYDLVLMDWKMPGMNGLTASRIIRNSPAIKAPAIIMVSAYAREDLMHQADDAGLDGYLIKPVSPSLLFNAIMAAFGIRRTAFSGPGPKEPARPVVESIRGARLLVVEDNEINQQVARGILENNGFLVTVADNGISGIAALEAAPYDAVLMDIHMPEMDGYTAAREIRKKEAYKDLPIIAMTANAMAGDREKALDAGMNDHVAKPIDVSDLLNVLCRWVSPTGKEPVLPEPGGGPEKAGSSPGDVLGPLPGINTESGLERLGGDTALYRDLLNKFAGSQGCADINIQKALDSNDPETARMIAHTIKGVAGNMGADPLFEAASDLDTALKQENTQKALQLLPVFAGHLKTVIQSIAGLEAQNPDKTAAADHGADPEAIRSLLAELETLIEDNDTAATAQVRQLSGMIQDGPGKDLLLGLSREIKGYDFESAKNSLGDLGRTLGIRLEK